MFAVDFVDGHYGKFHVEFLSESVNVTDVHAWKKDNDVDYALTAKPMSGTIEQ